MLEVKLGRSRVLRTGYNIFTTSLGKSWNSCKNFFVILGFNVSLSNLRCSNQGQCETVRKTEVFEYFLKMSVF